MENYRMPRKVVEQLIKINEENISRLEKSLQNPVQRLVGTSHILVEIMECKTDLKRLKEELED